MGLVSPLQDPLKWKPENKVPAPEFSSNKQSPVPICEYVDETLKSIGITKKVFALTLIYWLLVSLTNLMALHWSANQPSGSERSTNPWEIRTGATFRGQCCNYCSLILPAEIVHYFYGKWLCIFGITHPQISRHKQSRKLLKSALANVMSEGCDQSACKFSPVSTHSRKGTCYSLPVRNRLLKSIAWRNRTRK